MDSDGTNIYIGGQFTNIGGVSRRYLAKVNASGVVDPTWNPDPSARIWRVTVDGSYVYAGGDFRTIDGISQGFLARINADGSLDQTWTPKPNYTVVSIVVEGTDVYVGGNFRTISGVTRNRIARISTSGVIDPTFNPNANGVTLWSIAIDGNDIYVAGDFTTIGGATRNSAAKLNKANGALDPTWNPNANQRITSLVSLDSYIYVAGRFTSIRGASQKYLAKLNKTNGEAIPTWGPNPAAAVWSLSTDNKNLYSGGYFGQFGGKPRSNLAKFNPDGSLDEDWDPAPNATIRTLKINDGNLYIGGAFTAIGGHNINRLAKVSLTDGTTDSNWNPTLDNAIYAIAIDDNHVYAGGQFTNAGNQYIRRLARFNKSNGAIDATWTPDPSNTVHALAIDDNHLYAGGRFTYVGGSPFNYLSKISKSDGTPDLTWTPNVNNLVYSLAIKDNDLYMGGVFTTVDGNGLARVARLNKTNALPDISWKPNPNSAVYAIHIQENSIYVGGAFSIIGGARTNRIAEINLDGSISPYTTYAPNSSVQAISMSGKQLFIGGNFTSVNGDITRKHFAVFKVPVLWNGTSWHPEAPNDTDNVFLTADYHSTSNGGSFSAKNLTVTASATLQIAPNDYISISSDLSNSGTITIKNNGSLIQTKQNPNNSGTGLYIMEREGDDYRGRYNYWSSPVADATVDAVFGNLSRHIYTFNAGSQSWARQTSTYTIPRGVGIIATGSARISTTITREFSSQSGFNSGDISTSVIANNPGEDWNLLGNPYPSGLDFASFYEDNKTTIANTAYLWDSDGSDYTSSSNDYATITSAGAVSAGGGNSIPSTVISSGQSFFIEGVSTGNVTFSNSHRSTDNDNFLRKEEWKRLWINATSENGAGNQVLLAFIPDASKNSDIYDGKKRSESKFLSLFMPADFGNKQGSVDLAIQGLPSIELDQNIPLGIEAKSTGKYTFTISKVEGFSSNTQILLYDAKTETYTDLTMQAYTISLETGVYRDRFSLKFIVPSNEITAAWSEPIIFSTKQTINIKLQASDSQKASLAIYDLSGKQVFSESDIETTELQAKVNQQGIYIIKLATQDGIFTKKIFVY